MKRNILHNLLACVALCSTPLAWAQDAPGADPIVLNGNVSYLSLPTAPPTMSGQMDPVAEIPSWVQAKIARYEAKAFSYLDGGDGTIHTDKDVISRQTGNALARNCTTEVASNTFAPGAVGPAGRYGPGSQDQIVVLRGDLVSICK